MSTPREQPNHQECLAILKYKNLIVLTFLTSLGQEGMRQRMFQKLPLKLSRYSNPIQYSIIIAMQKSFNKWLIQAKTHSETVIYWGSRVEIL